MNFGLFGAKVAPNGEFLEPSVECKVLVSHPYGVRSEAILRVYFGCTVPPVLTYTLWMAGRDTLFSNTLHPTEVPGIHRLGSLWPKMTKNHPKKVPPFFSFFFSKVPKQPDHAVAES